MLPESYLGWRRPCFLDEGGAKEDEGSIVEGGKKRRGEKSPARKWIGSHGVVRIFTHKDGQYANC